LTSPAIAQTQPEIAPLEAQSSGLLFTRRLWAVFFRHACLYIGSWPRILQLVYWPMINILAWGFTSFYIVKKMTGAAIIGNVLVGGVLLNEVFMRTNFMMVILFLEEIWSRNLGHLFASPLKLMDYTFSIIGTSLICMTISIIPAMAVAQWLFGFSILSFGWPLAAFYVLLAFNGFWYGLLVLAMLLRYGPAAEWLGWMSIYLLTPLIAPYYPVSILPSAMQYVSWSLPATYVFESMKSVVGGGDLHGENLWIALVLNCVYLVLASFVFRAAYRSAQRRGGILQVGE
jgi:ABC-2 type transport system permease protein